MKTEKKPVSALILGGANCVFNDYKKAMDLFVPDFVIATNDVGTQIEHIDYWGSMHPDKMDVWYEERKNKGFLPPKELWTGHDRKYLSGKLPFKRIPNRRGGSGLLVIYGARTELQVEKIVLAGMPMDKQFGHYFLDHWWKTCEIYRIVWEKDKSLSKDIRSFSGWTMNAYGMPTSEWLLCNT